MHEAYQVLPLLKLSVQIECIAAFEDNLIIGTRQGHLLVYRVVPSVDEKFKVELTRYNKTFSKKAIQQLEAIPEHNLLVTLSDNIVQVHDISSPNFPVIQQISASKGATIFTLDTKKTTSLTGEVSLLIRMCVAVKKKLQFYYWKNNKDSFMTLADDIILNDIPKALAWCQETICVGFKGEYLLYQLNGKVKELFPTSSNRSNDPCILKVSDTTFALGKDTQTVLVNVQGDPEKSKALKWSDIPLSMAWDKPYIIGITSEGVDVQTIEPNGLVQKLEDLSKVRLIAFCKQGLLFVASVSQVWCLHSVDISQQRQQLLSEKQFQLALKLTEVSSESEDEKKEKINQIQTLLAYDLFRNKDFDESMQQFLKLGTDPYEVIRLFPEMLPQHTGSNENNEPVESLTESELEKGILALIIYLTEKRRLLQTQNQGSQNATGNLNEKSTTNKTQQLLQIIDTTLLKCYLQTNDALVAPLLRLNYCHLGETEKTLKKHQKHNELIILYQTKGQHRKALELLHNSDGGMSRTVKYLQNLGAENMGLILEFSDWVLQSSPEEGLKIFMEDLAEVEALPRARVLDYLLRSHPSLVIAYLEHIVNVWNDKNPLFHNVLVRQYCELILNDAPSAAVYQKKLLEFLETSTCYSPDTVLLQLPNDRLLEERAVVLGRLGYHEDAIAIYVRALGDIQKAVKYCQKFYSKNGNSKEVFVTLIKMVLDPNSTSLDSSGLTLSPLTAQPDLEAALKLMEDHSSCIDPLSVLAVISDNIPVTRTHHFLSVALHNSLHDRRVLQLLKGLLYAEHLQCQDARFRLQSQNVLITDLNTCPVCKKRFGHQSALIRYPNGEVVHYSCQEKKT